MDSNDTYLNMPTIADEKIIFVSENDLWSVPIKGGIATRLTTSQGAISYPKISPDGKWVAFVSTDEGISDIYIMPTDGGSMKRLTYIGGINRVRGWSLDQEYVIFSSNGIAPHRARYIYKVPFKGGETIEIPVGPAMQIDYNPKGLTVIGRFSDDNARWKHYKGGLAGDILIDASGDGEYRPLIKLEGNLVLPHFFNDNIVFLSDHEGISNIYSVNYDGTQLTKLTQHTDYYVRNISVNKDKISYQSGGEIYVLQFNNNEPISEKIPITLPSMHVQRARKFVSAEKYLEDFDISRNSTHLFTLIRGKVYHFGFWEGGVDQLGVSQGVRYKEVIPLTDETTALISDESGEYKIEVYSLKDNLKKKETLDIPIGVPYVSKASPDGKFIALLNNKYELLLINVVEKSIRILSKDKFTPTNLTIEEKMSPFHYFDWAPDSKWLTYSAQVNLYLSSIFLYSLDEGKSYQVTPTEFYDYKPVFDPEGRYIYFISLREFNPFEDRHYFRFAFVKSSRICAINLTKDLGPPFVLQPKAIGQEEMNHKKDISKGIISNKPIKIDLENIQRRVIQIPMEEAIYLDVQATKDQIFFTTRPILPISEIYSNNANPLQKLEVFNIETLDKITIEDKVTEFKLSLDKKALVIRVGDKLKVISSSRENHSFEKSEKSSDPSRKSGWIDLQRVKVLVDPVSEWKQMFLETWRLMRDHYWKSDMHGLNWDKIYDKYVPLLSKISTREEYSDLIWEMIAETGTSHSYENLGDYKKAPDYKQGFLGGEFSYSSEKDGYIVSDIIEGDNWNPDLSSPLDLPGIDIEKGDIIHSINGHKIIINTPIGEYLLNEGVQNVNLVVEKAKTGTIKVISVKTLTTESHLRYRAWVTKNRQIVSKLSQNRLGYLHIPDMSLHGLVEFYRAFKNEITKEGLIVDVRFNSGGNTSQLFLEMITSAQKITGYDKTRHSDILSPYFTYSTEGPIIGVTNEFAGSDGDIFSHNFKMLKIGPLIGKRTWGGVVGIIEKIKLVDKSVVTQPEYAFWFKDVEWNIENHGAEPDIEIEYFPQDFKSGIDPQLNKALELALNELSSLQIKKPKTN